MHLYVLPGTCVKHFSNRRTGALAAAHGQNERLQYIYLRISRYLQQREIRTVCFAFSDAGGRLFVARALYFICKRAHPLLCSKFFDNSSSLKSMSSAVRETKLDLIIFRLGNSVPTAPRI